MKKALFCTLIAVLAFPVGYSLRAECPGSNGAGLKLTGEVARYDGNGKCIGYDCTYGNPPATAK